MHAASIVALASAGIATAQGAPDEPLLCSQHKVGELALSDSEGRWSACRESAHGGMGRAEP
jgi:hypothetical protein